MPVSQCMAIKQRHRFREACEYRVQARYIPTMTNAGKWEKRWHPIFEQWVVYAAHRNTRPWSVEKSAAAAKKEKQSYDPSCYLCPCNSRINSTVNPAYAGVYIFDNDHPVVGMNAPEVKDISSETGLYHSASAQGIARVICYHEQHDLSMSTIPKASVEEVFLAFQTQTKELSLKQEIQSVFIFENRGELVGVSNSHPHCQLYATDFVFENVQEGLFASAKHRARTGRSLFADIVKEETYAKVRVVAENEFAIAFVPFFARWAYEVMVFPKGEHQTLTTMSETEIRGMASLYREVVRRYDGLYGFEFPYVMSLMQAPVDGEDYDHYRLHLWLQPPLRQPNLQKFPAGPERGGGNFMADTIPEEKAAELRAVKL